MEDINIKSIRYPAATDDKLEQLTSKLGRTKRLFFIQMVDYFYKSKKDPADLSDELLKKELIGGVSRIISFVRKQESDFLLPVFSDIGKLFALANAHTKLLNGISHYAASDQEQTKQILIHMALDRAIAKTQTSLDEKAVLKNQFKKILEYYITHRELLG